MRSGPQSACSPILRTTGWGEAVSTRPTGAVCCGAMRVVLVVSAGLAFLLACATARLGTPRALAQADDERLRLMHETISYTDVVDAADGDDRFDLHVHLGYARLRDRAAIYRERTRADGRSGATKVAESARDVSQLALGVDVGLYRDLMAFVRMPLVLSDARSLRAPSGQSAEQRTSELSDPSGPDSAQPLFDVPLSAPTRAGLDYLAFGGAWGVLNQTRRPALPTWVLRIEGRRALGVPLRACRTSSAGVVCGSQGVEDRDGDGSLDGTRAQRGRPGSSRGMSALLLETRFSHRYRRAEPYAGLGLQVEWPSTAKRAFRPSGLRGGLGRARPGPESSATLGVALIPWENRGTFQRLVFDLRLLGTHVARGTDYSPLFDALGTSSHPELARARYEGARGSAAGGLPPCSDENATDCGVGQRVSFYGPTEIAPHLRYGGQLGLEVQAARYVRFAVGSSLQWVTAHALTGRAPCAGEAGSADEARSDEGSQCSAGRVDARERAVIDAPGHRFELRDQLLLNVYAQATAMF